ncbi:MULTISPECIES: 2-oxoglutarate dehydrogenase complex dihydrolipoyllysine-residue succinyltransferase [unclassified Lentimonas]|uniref:2-oxoglutarate dehydrogenase complex dihydrolipoyllysine-residue succinyltransferase n=1 Tax=unclassified Lentimonas TaxID=2630993 RepID=UPI00132C8089|nr:MULTISPECIES: 2-oxoglutarate dehydrogenase complex dihydrolipoyllysine-residue succinyltransferase [unclassified Lentimonas]CAA6677920.1 Dihydrolipoamide succinyltransferase component (E2) of 2-oxoglutarate dehydrogenase complex (EC [Lentimonas sp. CC4]CAA6684024.1 Dihydrolipoamide succinyltransferase component (E2) of 2-oxoglutarate dehydrogenase complex (EC [Lentimonas sp. CC6]CAA7076600.1 Dihydrolipoamide succinyltransferase component (E2) of 2-oxoglutarate dehydrogenase complex (EC [Lenti
MATEVKIPAMGESISSGILAAWHVKDGDYVTEGQAIFELETDKITSEANAEVAGVITLQVAVDDEVDIGQVVATIDESATAPAGGSEAAPATEASAPAAAEVEATAPATSGTQHPLSPAARKAAEETGVNTAAITGSGKDGRVTKSDILSAAAAPATAAATPTPAAPKAAPVAVDPATRETRKKMSPLRRKIAERLVTATQECALLTTFNEVDMSSVMKLRKQHQEKFVERHGIKLGFMSFFTKAVTHALQAVPAVNARIEGNEIVTQHFYDIGVAVGTDKGLMVPTIRDCDQKGFAEIEQDIIGYAKAARDGKIQMSDLEGGVFTISNGGIYGSMLSTPIINYPQPAILGLHNITERAVVVNGEIVIRPMMYLALSYDHRLIDGKEAVTFLNKIKDAIEDPSRLLFGI